MTPREELALSLGIAFLESLNASGFAVVPKRIVKEIKGEMDDIETFIGSIETCIENVNESISGGKYNG